MSERRNPAPAAGRRNDAPPWGEPAGYPSAPSQGTRFLVFLRERWWVPALTSAFALAAAAAFLALQPPAYSSFASLRLNGKQTAIERNLAGEELRFCVGTQAGPLQKEKISQRIQERLLEANADPTPCPVRVTITQDPSAAVFILEATGVEPAYTRAYLDAVIEDYLDSKRPARANTKDDALASLSRQIGEQEQELKAGQAKLADFQRATNPALLQVQSSAASACLAKLNGELADLKLEAQLATAQLSLQRRIQVVEASLIEWDAKLVDANRGLAELDRLKTNVQRAQTLYDGLLNRLQSTKAIPSPDPELVLVTAPATPAVPLIPSWPLHLAAAGLAGLFVGLAILYFVAASDDRIRSLAELGDRFDEEILGQVPETPRDRRTKQLKTLDPDDERQMFAESYRNIRSSLVYLARSGTRPKLLLVTSAAPSEGKSTISVNLARALAFAGSRVLLIDADLRRGTLHEHLGLPAEPGLTELLTLQPVAKNDTQSAAQLSVRTFAHEALTTRSKLSPAIARALEQAVDLLDERLAQRIKKVMVPTAVPNLFFVPCGQFANNAADLFLRPSTEAFLKQVRDRFDYVIVDSAPVFAADDTTSLAPKMDSVIFVIRHAYTGADLAREALELLYQRQVNVLGLIFNRANPRSRKYHYYKYTSYYGSKKN